MDVCFSNAGLAVMGGIGTILIGAIGRLFIILMKRQDDALAEALKRGDDSLARERMLVEKMSKALDLVEAAVATVKSVA